jgi:hypothetical protein
MVTRDPSSQWEPALAELGQHFTIDALPHRLVTDGSCDGAYSKWRERLISQVCRLGKRKELPMRLMMVMLAALALSLFFN